MTSEKTTKKKVVRKRTTRNKKTSRAAKTETPEMVIANLNETVAKELAVRMNTVADLCIKQLQEIAAQFGLKVDVEVLILDMDKK